jgi:hypothetical protein
VTTSHHTLGPNRAALQWTLGILSAIPMGSALGEILRGPQAVPGGSPDVVPTVDSALRYANVFKFAAGVTILRELGRIDRSPAATFALSTVAVGGLARIVSWRQRGRPHPAIVGAIALETIGVPILLTWQRRQSAKAV